VVLPKKSTALLAARGPCRIRLSNHFLAKANNMHKKIKAHAVLSTLSSILAKISIPPAYRKNPLNQPSGIELHAIAI